MPPPTPSGPTLYLDERADRAIASLTRRLAHAARRPSLHADEPHDFLVPLLDPVLLERAAGERTPSPAPGARNG